MKDMNFETLETFMKQTIWGGHRLDDRFDRYWQLCIKSKKKKSQLLAVISTAIGEMSQTDKQIKYIAKDHMKYWDISCHFRASWLRQFIQSKQIAMLLLGFIFAAVGIQNATSVVKGQS